MSARLRLAARDAAIPLALALLAGAVWAFVAGFAMGTSANASAMELGTGPGQLAASFPATDADAGCRTCHTSVMAFYTLDGHAGLACTECHGWHEGPSSQAGLTDSVGSLCQRCHDTSEGAWHEASGEREDEFAGGPLTCVSSCHDPHGTAFPSMTSAEGDALCVRCHRGVGVWE